MTEVAEMPESLHSLSFEDNSLDPEAHSVVTDFLDYTEHLPSDIIRSFTLIGELDKAYSDAAAKVHDLTRQYGKLPDLPPSQRPDARTIRRNISSALHKALNCRQAAAAEANRINEVVKRQHIRLNLIKTKLQALPKPPSRDPTPAPPSPMLTKSKKSDENTKVSIQEKRRRRKGLVLDDVPTADVDVSAWNEQAAEETEVSPKNSRSELKIGSARTPKTPNYTRSRIPKTPKERRTGLDGQPLHHRVSVISTSNALALLTPPPENALPGSKWRPWMKLTEYELAVIRKTMKKNVSWVPSSAMITRYLSAHDRGPENYQIAKAIAESSGVELLDEEPESKDLAALAGRPDDAAESSSPGLQLESESQRLLDAGDGADDDDVEMADAPLVLPSEAEKKVIADYFTVAHRPRTRRATQDATQDATQEPSQDTAQEPMPMDEINKKINEVSQSMKTIFDQPPTPSSTLNESGTITGRSERKRKRAAAKDDNLDSPAMADAKQDNKRLRTSRTDTTTIIKSPVSTTSGLRVLSTTTIVPLAPEGFSPAPTTTEVERREANPIEVAKSRRKSADNSIIQATAAQPRPKRLSVVSKDLPSANIDNTAHITAPRASRSSTRSGGTTSVKAASAEPPPSRREKRESRRLSGPDKSIVATPTTNQRSSRRKPPPGIVAVEEDGKATVSIGPPKSKSKGGRKSSTAKTTEEDQPPDPNEPTYCVCDDISWGEMVACENDKCEKEWFHLECVNLAKAPGPRIKWFCPLCRDKLRIDEKGNPTSTTTGRRK